MKYRIVPALFLFALFMTAAFPAGAQAVSGNLSAKTVSRGSSVNGRVILDLPEGLHVNSNRPSSEYLIPTAVSIAGQGLKVVSIEYPEGEDRTFQFSREPLNVYQGKVVIPFTVFVPRRFRGDSITVRATIKYQACTDEVCYPPKDEEVRMTAGVR